MMEEEALSRKERLKALREAAALAATPDGDTGPRDGTAESTEPEVKFRSYVPRDQELAAKKLPPKELPKFEEPTPAQPVVLEATNEDLLSQIAPRKENWDLRRDVAKRLAKLEKRTQRALVMLMQEEERRRQQEGEANEEENVAS